MVKVSAPGNLFFLGEHSVVYDGRPALIGAPDRRTTIILTPRQDGRVRVVSTYGEFEEGVDDLLRSEFPDSNSYNPGKKEIDELTGDELLSPARDIIGEYGRKHGGLGNGFDVGVVSTVARCGGMSSSTGFSVPLVGALNVQFRGDLYKEEIWPIAYATNVKIHGGFASGAEANSSIRGGFHKAEVERIEEGGVLKRLETTAEKLDIEPVVLVVGETGVRTQTKKTVAYVAEGRKNAKAAYDAIFDRIKGLVEEGVGHLVNRRFSDLGNLMDRDHELLARELGVSHPLLNRLVDAARDAGAYGAKMCGGGKGGLMVALVDPQDEETATRVIKALQDAGSPAAYKTVLGGEGLRIEG